MLKDLGKFIIHSLVLMLVGAILIVPILNVWFVTWLVNYDGDRSSWIE